MSTISDSLSLVKVGSLAQMHFDSIQRLIEFFYELNLSVETRGSLKLNWGDFKGAIPQQKGVAEVYDSVVITETDSIVWDFTKTNVEIVEMISDLAKHKDREISRAYFSLGEPSEAIFASLNAEQEEGEFVSFDRWVFRVNPIVIESNDEDYYLGYVEFSLNGYRTPLSNVGVKNLSRLRACEGVKQLETYCNDIMPINKESVNEVKGKLSPMTLERLVWVDGWAWCLPEDE